VALVNRQFAVKVFGSVQKAVGGHFKFWGGTRAEVVGVVEDGKYRTLTEDQQPAMFFSFQQHKSSGTWLLVRSRRDPEEISRALEQKLHSLDAAMPLPCGHGAGRWAQRCLPPGWPRWRWACWDC
jgi:hypothetical protein